jgi:hypothetical protein
MVINIRRHYYISLNPKYSELIFQEKKPTISNIFLSQGIIENYDNYKTLINEIDIKVKKSVLTELTSRQRQLQP